MSEEGASHTETIDGVQDSEGCPPDDPVSKSKHALPSSGLEVGSLVKAHGLEIGDFVIIHDLQGAKELNGLPGEIVRYMAETSRFGVRLPGCVEPRAVKPDNLRRGVGRVGGAPALVEESMPKDLELLPNGRRRCRLHENPLIDDQGKLWCPFCVRARDWNSSLANWS